MKTIEQTKRCSKCKKVRPFSAFSKNRIYKDGLAHRCKKCRQEYNRSLQGRATKKRYNKLYGTTVNGQAARRRAKARTRGFSITSNDYNYLYEQQQGCCAICGRHQSEFDRRLAIDHDHKTGQIRGLLCTHCNLALGLMRDNITILQKAISYLTISDSK